MATIPGTKFAQGAPSESTGQVLMSSPQEDGGQQIAAGIEKMGAAIVGYAINVQKQEMSVEYYERKRQIDEAGWSAHNAVTGDEEADNKLWEKFESDAQAIAQSSKYKDVNSLLANHLNQVAPNWHQGIYTRSLTIRKENARDQLKLEWTKSLENGDTKTANDLLNNALKLGAITQTEHDNFMKIAPAQAHLLRAERALSMGNNEAVLAELDQTKDMNLTTEQLKQKEALRVDAEKARDDLSRNLINDTLGKIASGMQLNEVGDLIKQTIGLDSKQKTNLMKVASEGARIWQEKKIDPYTNRQDEVAFADMLHNVIKNPQSVSEDEIWMGTGKLWTTDDTLMLLNKKNKTGDTWYKESHPVVQQYMGSLWDLYAKDKIIPDDVRPEWAEKRLQLEEAMNRVGPDAAKIENEFQLITADVKKRKAKKWLEKITSTPESTSFKLATSPYWWVKYVNPNIWAGKGAAALGRKLVEPKAPVNINTPDEAKKLPKGTRFIYQGKEYERN